MLMMLRRKNPGASGTMEAGCSNSQYYGREEDVHSERTHDQCQDVRSHSFGSDDRAEDRGDLVSVIRSEYTDDDRYDDLHVVDRTIQRLSHPECNRVPKV